MAVFATVRIKADPKKFQEYAKDNLDVLQKITEDAKANGAQHHRFVAGDGEVVAMDTWESADGFQKFFGSNPDIPGVMEAVGAEGEPQVEFFDELTIGDEF